MVYCFEAIITSRGFHVCKERTWSTAKVGDETKVELKSKPYSCAIKAKHKYFRGWKAVGHIPPEILQSVYFFIKQEGGRVYGKLKENPLWFLQEVLRSHSYSNLNPKTNVSRIQRKNLENFYSFNFAEDLVGNDEDEEEIDIETLDIENSNENDES